LENNDYVDVNKFASRLATKLESIRTDPDLSDSNRDLILKYIRDSKLGKTIRIGQKRKIGDARNLQVASFLTRMAKDWFKKDLDKVDMNDMESFIMKLEGGEIASKFGTPMKSESQSNIKKFFRKFYKHIHGNGKVYPDMVDWFDTSKEASSVDAVNDLKVGVERIVELIPDIMKKALVLVTFDSGFRAGEILNVRLKDLEKRDDGVYFITCRYSKTRPRTVGLPLSSELLERFVSKFHKNNTPDTLLFDIDRSTFYDCVRLYGNKALDQKVTIHMLRHTSATYYASRLDRVTLCKRFGWSYSSKSPDRYIDFAKVDEGRVIDIINGEKGAVRTKEFEELRLRNAELESKINGLSEMENRMKQMEAMMIKRFGENY